MHPQITRSLQTLIRLWAFLWLLYDSLDFALNGSVEPFFTAPDFYQRIHIQQLALILCHFIILQQPQPSTLLLACATCIRGVQYSNYGLNDFGFACVFSFLFTILPPHLYPKTLRFCLALQLGWIYLATAILKWNPIWLSGSELFIRQHHFQANHHWPFPHIYTNLWEYPSFLATLSTIGLFAEALLGLLLLLLACQPASSLFIWPACLSLVVAIHTFAALTVNVWMFGALLLLLVVFILLAHQET